MSINRHVLELRRNPEKRIRANVIRENVKVVMPADEDCSCQDGIESIDLSNLDSSEPTSPLHDPEHKAGYMAKQNLFLIGEMASRLAELVQESDELAPWMEQKITTALNEIEAVFRHAEYKVAQETGLENEEDLEEDLSIKPSGGQIKESMDEAYDSPDLLVLEEASEILANAESEITNLAKVATIDGNRMTLAKASRQLRDLKTDLRARVNIEKMKMKMGTRG